MRMNLKGTSKRNKIFNIKNVKLNSRNLFIFLISFSVVSILLGMIFYFIMSSGDQESVNSVIINNLKISDSYNYIDILKNNILSNTYNILLIWILGISVIGLIANIFIYFCELFSIGFTISSIIATYKSKSIIGILVYLFPSKIIYIMVMFILTYFSIKFSYKIISTCFFNNNIDLKREMHKYFKVLLFSWIVILGISLLSTFIDPIFIKVFTKI